MKARPSLRSVIALSIVISAILSGLLTAGLLTLNARDLIYETQQNALLDGHRKLATGIFELLDRNESPYVIDYQLSLLPGPSTLYDTRAGTFTGPLNPADIPEEILLGAKAHPQQLQFQRAVVDGKERFFISWAAETSGKPTPALIISYSLAEQSAQVATLLRTSAIATAVGVTLLLGAGTLLGVLVFRPLRRLRDTAARMGDAPLPELHPSWFSDVNDIASALRTAAEENQRVQKALREREAASRRLVADVAHELRTPVTSMLAVEETLEDVEQRLAGDERAAIQIIRRGSVRLASLVEDLLEVSRIDAGFALVSPVQFRLAELLLETAELSLQSVEFTVRCDPELSLETDPERLATIINNLLRNAELHGSLPVMIEVTAADESIVIDISDAGPGIPEAEHSRVFERFVRLEASGTPGTGLGLSIARENARLLGGDLTLLASTSGAHFRLTVPGRPHEK